jgi:hypothetical protein
MAAASSPETLLKSDNLHKLEEFDIISKLRRGYKVTDIEKESLLTLASSAEAEAMSIDTEIARLRALLLELEHSRDSLWKAANQARSLIAPIRKLPPEILGEIFFLTDPSIHFSDGWLTAYYHRIPTVLAGTVCLSWRDIAISTPKLWSLITIATELGLPPRMLQRFEEVLELSGNVLLDLTVKTPLWPTLSEEVTASAVFPIIHKHCQRWKHVTLKGHPDRIVSFFRIDLSPYSLNSESSALSLQLPSLCSLELDIAADEEPEPAPMVLHIPSVSAPNLRYLSILKTYDDHGGLSFDLPWRQLDTLMFGARYLSEFFDALSNATSLTQACLHDCLFVRQIQPPRPISSDALTSLRFRLIDDVTYRAMLTCFEEFTLPHLRELHICGEVVDGDGYSHSPEWPTDPFKAFVNRSGFPITMLTILGVPMRDYTLVDILECLPQLEALVAEEPGSDYFSEGVEAEGYKLSWLTNHLMEKLHVRGREPARPRIIGNPVNRADASTSDPNCEAGDSDSIQEADPFLPYLRELTLKGKGSPDVFSFKIFLEMVRSRHAPAIIHHDGSISTLRRVELRVLLQRIDEAVEKEIDNLRDGALVLDVICDNM